MNPYITEKSSQKFNESKQFLAGGVASSLRAAMKPVPLFVEKASGSRIVDVDGNTYIDYLLAYGPLILGHAHPALIASVNDASQRGVTYGLQHDGEIQLAKRLTQILPCADKVALSGSGTEAVMLALRLARAYNGKRKIVRFHGHYHGWSDSIFTSFPSPDMHTLANKAENLTPPGTEGQSENSLEDIILLPWNDAEALELVLRQQQHEIAAVISEPVMCNSGCLMPKSGYLEHMRALTQELGIVMILDEVITGFRVGLGGAHGRFGLMPDLVTIGKAMGCGIAISGVAGSRELLEQIDHGKVSHLGTLNGNGLATAAALATITELSREEEQYYIKLEQTGTDLASGIRELLALHQIPGVVNQLGPVFHMMFTHEQQVEDFDAFNKRDAAKYSRFAELMLEAGVLVRTSGLWYVSTEHSAVDVRDTLKAVEQSLVKL
ncbi:aspartate aminotransferase family protein [Paenibacillus sp. FSL H7-0331]|uniref:aspartate aminotransferase family protein n=1 Tax=Paenibacillus sp. FSL H7-0331 TaxID=1920421 RepID=UPI0021171F13|nr:aspartate aminotransferase family protein [Paenibacillus sp. FSL H7-0331]